jgi:hypothetical protein
MIIEQGEVFNETVNVWTKLQMLWLEINMPVNFLKLVKLENFSIELIR